MVSLVRDIFDIFVTSFLVYHRSYPPKTFSTTTRDTPRTWTIDLQLGFTIDRLTVDLQNNQVLIAKGDSPIAFIPSRQPSINQP